MKISLNDLVENNASDRFIFLFHKLNLKNIDFENDKEIHIDYSYDIIGKHILWFCNKFKISFIFKLKDSEMTFKSGKLVNYKLFEDQKIICNITCIYNEKGLLIKRDDSISGEVLKKEYNEFNVLICTKFYNKYKKHLNGFIKKYNRSGKLICYENYDIHYKEDWKYDENGKLFTIISNNNNNTYPFTIFNEFGRNFNN